MGLSCIFPLKATPLKIKTLKPIHIHWKNWNQTSEDKKKTSIKTNPLICIYDYIDMCINIYIYIFNDWEPKNNLHRDLPGRRLSRAALAVVVEETGRLRQVEGQGR